MIPSKRTYLLLLLGIAIALSIYLKAVFSAACLLGGYDVSTVLKQTEVLLLLSMKTST
ncbi:hypothetical protein [Synechocystis sp. PCC 7509]|uniref:hypothetical protein n=1 Tax=Synechocystis sp. PCC 7509 TaxID=927677 RepID=UPI0002F08B2A|nr:hypothetical protein [Synechocystis sp. PCC 7509]